jgi:hypothetical protein
LNYLGEGLLALENGNRGYRETMKVGNKVRINTPSIAGRELKHLAGVRYLEHPSYLRIRFGLPAVLHYDNLETRTKLRRNILYL